MAENTASGTDIGTPVAATDGDSDTLHYTLGGTDASSFTIVSSSGQLETSAALNHEDKSSYTVTVSVRDNKADDGTTDAVIDATQTVTIAVTNVDEAGTVTISGTFEGGEELTASVTDPDGNVTSLSWQWQREGTGGTFTNISGATSNKYTTVAADVGNKLKANASYTDDEGSGKSAETETSSAIAASNSAPTFDDGPSTTRTVPENSAAGTSVGSAVEATDGNTGDTLTYSLSGTDANSFTIVSTSGQIQTKSGVTYNYEASENSYSVTVGVRDKKDAAGNAANNEDDDDTIAVTINLTNVNEAPTASGLTTKNVPENTTTVATYMATDPDASPTFSWSVESSDDGGKFEISSSGALSFTTAPNFEMPTDTADTAMNNTYVVTVKVTDDGSPAMSDTRTVTVTVTNVNEAPTASGPTTKNVPENTTTVATYTATDPDASTTLSWSVESSDDGGKFEINSSGALSFTTAPDFEMPTDTADTPMNNTYVVTVKVTDDGSPAMSDTQTVTVTVTNVNEAPTASGPTTQNVPENTTTVATYTATDPDSTTFSWSVESSDDGGKFEISSSGALSFTTAPNFEMPTDTADTPMNNTYVVTVKVTDDGSPAMSDTHNVTVTVTNVNEAPTIDSGPTPVDFNENQPATTVVATYEASDVDASTTLAWTLEGNDAGDFTFTENVDGDYELKFTFSPNFEDEQDDNTDNDYEVTVKVTDNGIPGNRTATLNVTRDVTISVKDVNDPPVVTGNTSPSKPEIEYDATNADLTVVDYNYTDEDVPPDTITWDVGGTDSGDFAINSSTGVLSFAARPDFENPADADPNNVYEIIVKANDSTDTTDYPVIVTVTDINERPSFTGTPATTITVDEHDANETYVKEAIASYIAHDEEGGVTWSLTGTDSGDFDIDSAGAVTFEEAPNFEDPKDSGGNNVYNFTVVVTDVQSGQSRRMAEQAVTVTVEDVEEAGSISVSNLDPEVGHATGSLVTFELKDPDGGIVADFNWRIESREPQGNWSRIPANQLPASNNRSTTYTYTANEDHAGQEIRAVVESYEDRRGPGKSATSEATGAIRRDPSPNVPPRFRQTEGAIDEGPAKRVVGMLTATDRDNDTL